jgi:hypothetical protein
MKRQTAFFNSQFQFIYSTGILYTKYSQFYFFPLVVDIFNTAPWLKGKVTTFENKQLLKFKNKFSKKISKN